MQFKQFLRITTASALAAGAGLAGLAVASPAHAAGGSCTVAGTTVTCVYAYTGTEQTFTVPQNVSQVQVTAVGASGASGSFAGPPSYLASTGGAGGVGAIASSALSVTAGSVLYVEVGGTSTNAGADPARMWLVPGGWNGGGGGVFGPGGGASDIRTLPRTDAATLGSRLLVAGGGGGGGFSHPSANGGAAGQDGSPTPQGGGAGSLTAGGTGGTAMGSGGNCGSGTPGSLGQGGGGATFSGGGGGGGGYYGGGQGSDICISTYGGGGGGSSLVPAGGTVALAAVGTAPSIAISFTGAAPTGFTADTPPALGVTGSAYGPYTYAADGIPGPTYTIATGALPPGLALDAASGVLSGVPTSSGTYTFAVAATNPLGTVVSRTATLTVRAAPQTTACTPPTTAVAAAPYGPYAFAATGFPAPAFAVTSGALPPGLTLDAATGSLAGTPSTAGTYTFAVTATNAMGSAACPSVTITVHPALVITSGGTLSGGTVGAAYTATLTATGGDGSPYVWSLAPGSTLPPGLTLTGNTITGTPTQAGTYAFTVSVNDPVTQTLTLTIAAAPTPTPTAAPSDPGAVVETGGHAVDAGSTTAAWFWALTAAVGIALAAVTVVIARRRDDA
ncbi:Ig domain-containing protein [Sinomonas sp. ASV322]|uniref:Ig domain-containing protein n=1 Tax=Sinomonas sp. ASV322 TaxID=3041920 RepID=UPI0027DE7BA4|nr:Ig domain-containing protein [Sinomonas sp. ASV322]MDQ4502438.1 Ig domain-containing protein [Sinomonas sp. ASV322]